MNRLLLTSLVLVALIGGGAVASLAVADGRASDRLAEGVRIGGVDVGGMTRNQALVRLRDRVGAPARRPAVVRVGQRTFTLDAAEAGVRLNLRAAIERAYAAGREGNLLQRGWRELTGGEVEVDERAPIELDRSAVRSFVGSIHAQLARKPVDASLAIALESVSVSPSRPGRRLAGRDDLVRRVTAALRSASSKRSFEARLASVPPKVTEDAVFDSQPVAVTVARDGRTVRVFRRGEMVKSYRVAVGEPKYPTPTGRFTVQTKQVNPTWNVPQSEWAGELAGEVIPGGDPKNPLVARWIGFNGSVGFHGTSSIGSLGSAASHGCVRMSPADVIDLYERVETGTPVYVA